MLEIQGYKELYEQERLKVYNMDCIKLLKQVPDKYFDLAIVDPPYGINGGASNSKKFNVLWDKSIPSKQYFKELIRVSQNQIIWGGNYMSLHIPFNSTHTIIWNKENGNSFMSDGEIAFTSFKKNSTKFINIFWMSNMMKAFEKPIIHPTQKPVALYTWLLEKYAKPNFKIIDTHFGSGSHAIANHYYGSELIACELDTDYFKASIDRIKKGTRQLSFLQGGD